MKPIKLVKVSVVLPEDLLSYCYQHCGRCRLDPLNCLIENALMAYLGVGRCEKTGLLCSRDTPACELCEPRNDTQVSLKGGGGVKQ